MSGIEPPPGGRPANHPVTVRTAPRTREAAPPDRAGPTRAVEIPQYGRGAILGIWAAAALPMAALAWLVVPPLADRFSGTSAVATGKALMAVLTLGLVWQFVLVVALVAREQGTLRRTVIREALWLRSPRSPRSGRVGGRVWLVAIPLVVLLAAEGLLPSLPHPESRDLATLLGTDAGAGFFEGNWSWFALLLVSLLFNSVLGEELLFRGFLLPRMNGAFGRGDWVANGLLFAAYHLHVPWLIPVNLLDTFIISYPAKRYRSALIGIAVHSAQSILVVALVLPLVL